MDTDTKETFSVTWDPARFRDLQITFCSAQRKWRAFIFTNPAVTDCKGKSLTHCHGYGEGLTPSLAVSYATAECEERILRMQEFARNSAPVIFEKRPKADRASEAANAKELQELLGL